MFGIFLDPRSGIFARQKVVDPGRRELHSDEESVGAGKYGVKTQSGQEEKREENFPISSSSVFFFRPDSKICFPPPPAS